MNDKVEHLKGKTVVLGVTGGIAAYKACELVSRMKKAEAEVYVIMTKSACEFVQPMTLQTLSGHPVAVDTFSNPQYWEVEHIALAKKADLFIIAPATANIIAKLALGLGDDMLSTTMLASTSPLLIAPAMNTQMYQAPATQKNLAVLIQRGAYTVGPEGGMLACGDVGAGRMSEPQEILKSADAILSPRGDYAGLRVLVTAGPTREAIDPVRFLTNKSSGKMGYAIAEALLARGAQVQLVSGPVSLVPPDGLEIVRIESTQDLYQAVMESAPDVDMLIQAAAPADFTPVAYTEQKIKKDADKGLSLQFKQTPDVAKAAGTHKKTHQVFIGFAAETGQDMDKVMKKLQEKNLDMICFNDVTQEGAGFGGDTNILNLISQADQIQLPLLSKRIAADRILDEALKLRKAKL